MEQRADARERILQAGKNEFLLKGFRAASLRTIVKNAGMTTGAFYGYYTNKEALFHALVDSAAGELLNFFEQYQINWLQLTLPQQIHQTDRSREQIGRVITHIYDHYDAFRLIMCSAEGTEYERFIEKIVEIEMKSTEYFITSLKQAGCPVLDFDPDFLFMLIYAFFSGMFQIVIRGIPKEKAMEYLEQLRVFYSAGYFRILGI